MLPAQAGSNYNSKINESGYDVSFPDVCEKIIFSLL